MRASVEGSREGPVEAASARRTPILTNRTVATVDGGGRASRECGRRRFEAKSIALLTWRRLPQIARSDTASDAVVLAKRQHVVDRPRSPRSAVEFGRPHAGGSATKVREQGASR